MQKTKDKILNVVIQYIKENENIENITISKLAKRAGIGKSTIYEHFESKEDIITQTYNHLLNKYKNILSSEIQGTDFKSAFIEQVSKIHTVMKDASTIMDALMKREHKVFDNIGPEGKSCAKNIKIQVEKRFKD
jgi:AcrR family transcriptional regulator